MKRLDIHTRWLWGLVIVFAMGGNAFAESTPVNNQRLTSLFFGVVDYRQRENFDNDGFALGQAVAQFNFQIDSNLSAFTEMTATAKQDHGFEFEIERLFVRYDFSDQFKLSGGRYHTPLGYWNTAFHHGSWLQTTVARPETVKFGSNVIPIHFMGLLLEGNVAQTNFNYKLGFGNGRSEDIHDPGDLGDINDSPAFLGALNYRLPGRHRLATGVSLYIDQIEPELEPKIDEQIAALYVVLEGETPELIVEYTYSNHESSAERGAANSIYGQFAYRLGGKAYKWKPYIRAENLDVDDDDPLLGDLGLDYRGITAGVRWDFSAYAALKAEYRNEEFDNSGAGHGIWLQLAFVFDGSSSGGFVADLPPSQHPAQVAGAFAVPTGVGR